eukprot:ANDGO_08232.mRNA.1 Malonate--CoA ligase
MSLFVNAAKNLHRIAISHVQDARVFSYGDLLKDAASFALKLKSNIGPSHSLKGERIAFGVPSSYEYVVAQWAVWMLGAIAVPLSTSHPKSEMEHVIRNADAAIVVGGSWMESNARGVAAACSRDFLQIEQHARIPEHSLRHQHIEQRLPALSAEDPCMIIYTSGTTGKPKGVVTTHRNLETQCRILSTAWEWIAEDVTLHTLPLHHVHGIVNALTCPLWNGAHVVFDETFHAKRVWKTLVDGLHPFSVFMGVPTMYVKLIEEWKHMAEHEQKLASAALRRLRLMISGSAALPETVLHEWERISGHILLERYGMTELGMALSNPYNGQRLPGTVGHPLPTVDCRIVDENFSDVPSGTPGQLLVKGPSVFDGYWRNSEATRASFAPGNWFITGDVSVRDASNVFKILGRASVDILKVGGYKISALEIENCLLESGHLQECAVVGMEDPAYGQKIAAIIVPAKSADGFRLASLKRWAVERLAKYKVPTEWRVMTAIPRNTMGKVNKKELSANLHTGSSPS